MARKDSFVPGKVVFTPLNNIGPRSPRVLGAAKLYGVPTETTKIVKERLIGVSSNFSLLTELARFLLHPRFLQGPRGDLGRGAVHSDARSFIREDFPFSAPHHGSKENVMEFATSPGNISGSMGLFNFLPNTTAQVLSISEYGPRPSCFFTASTQT